MANNIDVFVSGHIFTKKIKSRVLNQNLLKYVRDNKNYSLEYSHIVKFYNDIKLDLSIYYEYFDIPDTIISRDSYDKIKHLKIVFTHTKASNMEINIMDKLDVYIKDPNYIVICANQNVYNKDNMYYNLASEYINMPIVNYRDIIINANKLYLINSCFSCILIPYKVLNKLNAEEIILYSRSGKEIVEKNII